jgi:hypothetical protein
MFSFLTQEDIADGWQIAIRKKKYKTNMEKDIYLSQLPPHLWYKLNLTTDDIIHDRIFKYKIIKTPHDDKVLELYNLIFDKYKNLKSINELYKYCLSININGWLMIKTKNIIN